MIASENFVPQAILECQGSVLTNKYAEGYPGQALLRRLRARRRHRAARDRPREGAVRRPSTRTSSRTPARRPTPPSTTRCCSRATRSWACAAARRPPQPRDEDQRLGPALRHRAVRGPPRGPPDRHGRGRADRARAPAEAAARRLVGLPAHPRLRALPRDRRRGRRAADGRHGALRRPRRRRPAPEPGAVRRRRHHHDPQDARRRARRPDPLPRGVREEDQLGRLPGPAGRPARARDRRQGGRAEDRRLRAVPRAPGAHGRGRQGGRRGAAAAPATASTCSPAAPTCTSCSSTCATPSSTASRPRTGCTTIGITVNRNAVPFDPRPPVVSSRPARRHARRSPRAACRPTTSPRSAASSPRALQPGFDVGAGELAERVAAIADRYPLYAQLGSPAAVV